MPLPFNDSFPADGPAGRNWTTVTGTWTVSGGRMTQTTSSSSAAVLLWAEAAGVADLTVQANLWRDNTDQKTVGLILRWVNHACYLGLVRNVAAGPDLWQIFVGNTHDVFTQLGSSTAEEFVDGSLVRFRAQGTSLKLQLWNGSAWIDKVSVTDSTLTAAGSVGIRTNSNGNPRFDNFNAAVLTPNAPTVPSPLFSLLEEA